MSTPTGSIDNLPSLGARCSHSQHSQRSARCSASSRCHYFVGCSRTGRDANLWHRSCYLYQQSQQRCQLAVRISRGRGSRHGAFGRGGGVAEACCTPGCHREIWACCTHCFTALCMWHHDTTACHEHTGFIPCPCIECLPPPAAPPANPPPDAEQPSTPPAASLPPDAEPPSTPPVVASSPPSAEQPRSSGCTGGWPKCEHPNFKSGSVTLRTLTGQTHGYVHRWVRNRRVCGTCRIMPMAPEETDATPIVHVQAQKQQQATILDASASSPTTVQSLAEFAEDSVQTLTQAYSYTAQQPQIHAAA